MTDKNAKKLMTKLGIPADKQDALLAASNDDATEFDLTPFLEAAKAFAEPLIKPGIEQAARKEGASGSISKMLKAIYDETKEGDPPPTFEEWKKTKDGIEYTDVIKETISASKKKGVSKEEAVIELTKKLEAALAANQETTKSIEKINADWQAKFDAKNLAELTQKDLDSFELKPINKNAHKYFLRDLEEKGIEIRLHKDKATPFKKGETIPLQDAAGVNFISLEDQFKSWAAENEGLFTKSGGNAGPGVGDDKSILIDGKKGVLDEKTNTINIPGRLPIPVEK